MNPFSAFFLAALEILDLVLDLYIWVLIIGAILSWLMAFGVINQYNKVVQVVGDFCYRLTEPVLSRIRRYLPAIGGIDLSPVVVIFGVMFIRSFIRHLMIG